MTPSPDLFNLIKSLKQTEKRYFKVYASKLSEGKEPEYLQLFDAIDEMAEYDETKLKEKFKGKVFVKQLHVVKNYLTEAILQSLAVYHDKTSVNNDLLRLLQTIEILYNKEQHELCFKQVERGIKTCKAYSKQDLLFAFLGWKARIMLRRQDYAQVLQTIEEQKQITHSLNTYLNAKDRALKLHQHIITKGFPRTQNEKEVLKTAHADLLRAQPEAGMGMDEAYYHFLALGKFYAALGEHKKRLEALNRLIGTLEKNKNYSLEHPEVYISVLGDYWIALITTGRIKQAQETFFKIRGLAGQLSEKKSDAKNYAILVSYILELDMSILTNETHKTVQLAPRIKEAIKKAEGVHQKSTTLELIYNTYRVSFISGKYAEALDWVNLILNEQMGHIREDLNISAHIFNLIIHYELGNALLLQGIISSTQNSLKYKHRLFKAEKTLLKYLQKLNKAKNEDEKRRIFQQLSDAFNLIQDDPNERKSAVDGDLWAWIESKLTGKPIGEILSERYRKEISGV